MSPWSPTYLYDNNGNQRVVTAPPNARTTLSWDIENHLTLAMLPSGLRNTFQYDGDGKRVRKDDSAGTAKFLWDLENIILETDATNITQAVYTLAPGAYGPLVSQFRASATSYYTFEGSGSSNGITSSTGSLTDSYVYDAFGTIKATTGNTVNPFRYIGRFGYYYDNDLITYQLRQRYYAPSAGRFLSRDTMLFYPVLNRYLYVTNNPRNRIDPSGHITINLFPPDEPRWLGCGKFTWQAQFKPDRMGPGFLIQHVTANVLSYNCNRTLQYCTGRCGVFTGPPCATLSYWEMWYNQPRTNYFVGGLPPTFFRGQFNDDAFFNTTGRGTWGGPGTFGSEVFSGELYWAPCIPDFNGGCIPPNGWDAWSPPIGPAGGLASRCDSPWGWYAPLHHGRGFIDAWFCCCGLMKDYTFARVW